MTIVAADLFSSRSLDVIVLFVFFASTVIFSVSPFSSSSSIDLGSRTQGSRIALKGAHHPFLRRGLLLFLSGEEEDDEDDDEAITLLPRWDERFVAIEVFFFREDKEEELGAEEHADEEDKTRSAFIAAIAVVILTLYV